jgi:zinc protease
LPDFNAVEWTLGNNARVVYRFADYQKDNVLFQGISPGGVSLFGPDMLPSAMMIPEFSANFGVGKFDATTLRKMLTGKNVNLRPELGELNEAFTGASSPKDFETLLQLLYLKFQEPRFDREAFEALKTRYIALIKNMEKNPQKIMSDSLQLILTSHNPRTILVTPAFFDKVTFDKMEKIYRDRFSDAGDFTFFIVGNVTDSVAKPMVEKYIGSLTDLPRIDNNEKFPEGKTVREIKIPLQTKKATIVIAYDHKLPWTPEDNMKLSVIRDLLTLRYTDEIREKEGGTYGVNVATQSNKFPEEEKSLQLNFDTDTAKAANLKPIIFREIEKLQESGPTQEDLGKVVQNQLKDREQAKPNNGYWMNMLTGYYRYNVNFDRPENFENILKALTVKDVQKYAKKFFSKADLVDIVFKPNE